MVAYSRTITVINIKHVQRLHVAVFYSVLLAVRAPLDLNLIKLLEYFERFKISCKVGDRGDSLNNYVFIYSKLIIIKNDPLKKPIYSSQAGQRVDVR